jgi:hypothetical protein
MSKIKVIAFVFCCILLSSTFQVSANIETNGIGNSDWTFMVYFVADSPAPLKNDELWMFPAINRMEKAGSSSQVNLIIQADDYDAWGGNIGTFGGTRRYLVQQDYQNNIFANYVLNENMWYLDEKNMGEPQTLVEFVSWVKGNYPADNYALLLFGHGAGWQGICKDVTSNEDKLDIFDLENSMSQIYNILGKKLDILFLWSCVMGQMELFYQLGEYVDIILASETTMSYCNDAFEEPLKFLINNPSASPEEFAQTICDNYCYSPADGIESYEPEFVVKLIGAKTVFGIKTGDINNIKDAVNNFATAMIQDKTSCRFIKSALQESELVRIHDLFEFANIISKKDVNQSIIDAACQVMDAINSASIISPPNPPPPLRGISIYSPPKVRFDKNYKNIDFAVDTQWDEFLDYYYTAEAENDSVNINKGYRGSFKEIILRFFNSKVKIFNIPSIYIGKLIDITIGLNEFPRKIIKNCS